MLNAKLLSTEVARSVELPALAIRSALSHSVNSHPRRATFIPAVFRQYSDIIPAFSAGIYIAIATPKAVHNLSGNLIERSSSINLIGQVHVQGRGLLGNSESWMVEKFRWWIAQYGRRVSIIFGNGTGIPEILLSGCKLYIFGYKEHSLRYNIQLKCKV